jgi:hypothetical protein
MSADDGKRALFSTAVRRPGTLVVDCSTCRGRSRLTYPEFVRRCLPVTVWIPWRRHSQWMVCPACERRTWMASRWFE